MKIVHKGPSDGINTFNSVLAALLAIGTNTSRYAIIVMPGYYYKDLLRSYDYYGSYNVDIIGFSRTGTIIDGFTNNNGAYIQLRSGMYLKNLTIQNTSVSFVGDNSGVIDSDINNFTGDGMGLYINSFMRNITVENIKINSRSYCIRGYAPDLTNTRINNVEINVTSGIGIDFYMYGPSPIGFPEFNNVKVNASTSLLASIGTLSFKNSSFNGSINVIDGSGYGTGNVNVSITGSSIRGNVTSQSPASLKIGGSQIDGVIQPGATTVVNCFDGNFVAIQNGTY